MREAPKTVAEWVQTIRKEKPYVDKKPFSHNIISLALQAIARLEGNKAANKVVRQLRLKRLGWSEVPE